MEDLQSPLTHFFAHHHVEEAPSVSSIGRLLEDDSVNKEERKKPSRL
jgi:hypothetical protein